MVGQRLREYRKKKGFKLAALAKIVGISHGSLSDIENEKTDPSTETLLKYVRNTDINLAWVFTGKGPMEWPDMVKLMDSVIAEERSPYYALDDVSAKILLLLKDMPEEARREILRSLEDKKLLLEIREERKKLKDAG